VRYASRTFGAEKAKRCIKIFDYQKNVVCQKAKLFELKEPIFVALLLQSPMEIE
jgi:hypothetical protein